MDRKSPRRARAELARWRNATQTQRPCLPQLLLCGLAMLSVCADTGCRKRLPPKVLNSAQIEAWTDLPGVRASKNAALQAELALVSEAQGTPRQLIPAALAEQDNAATALAALFTAPQVERGLARARQLVPEDSAEPIDAAWRREARLLAQSCDQQLVALHDALRRPACQFATQFQHGFFATRPYIDVISFCVLLERLQVAQSLDEDRPHDALVAIQAMFRLTSLLAADKLVESRLTAAELRAVTLAAVARLAEHPQLTHNDLLDMSQTVDQLLNNWPHDADAWIGDRAIALHSYEAIRAGYLLSLLTPDETEALRAEGLLESLPDRRAESIDADELFYLKAMREIIASCELPFYVRRKKLTEIKQRLHALRDTPDFPYIAGRLFLTDIDQGHYRQAEDRALCEAWSLALALAADRPRPPYRMSPLTGVAYAIDVTPQRVTVVTGPGGETTIDVPRS